MPPGDHQSTSIRKMYKLLSFLGERPPLLASPCGLGDVDKLSKLSPSFSQERETPKA